MTPANWITLIVTLLGLAITWGSLVARLNRAEKDVEKLAKTAPVKDTT